MKKIFLLAALIICVAGCKNSKPDLNGDEKVNSDDFLKAFPEIELNAGSKSKTSRKLKITAASAVRTDSLKNWKTNCFLLEPKTFRMPISLALRADLAVVRFI